MSQRFDAAYRVKRGDNLGDPEFWNSRLKEIDLRISSNEDAQSKVDAVLDSVISVALDRINTTISPLIEDAYGRIASIPTLFQANSISAVAIGTGEKSFTLGVEDRATWVASPIVFAKATADPTKWMLGGLVSFDRNSGVLVVDVSDSSGSGSIADWTISVSGRRGPQGLQGPAGLVFRGAYAAGTAYIAGDVVTDQGAGWVNIVASTGVAPPTLPATSNAKWQSIVQSTPATPATTDAGALITGTLLDARLPTRIGVAGKVIADADLAIANGFYYLASTAAHIPEAANGALMHERVDANAAIQTWKHLTGTTRYGRRMASGVWGDWYALADSQDTLDARFVLASVYAASIASVANIRAGTAGKVMTADANAAASAWVGLTDATTIAVDHAAGINRSVTLAGNRTFGAPTNARAGFPLHVWITQDATGGRTAAWNSVFDFGDLSAPVLSTGAGQSDLVTFICLSATKFAYLGTRLRVD